MQFSKMTGVERPPQNNSNILRLPLHGGPQYFEDEKVSKLTQFYTPQNRLISQHDPHSANSYSFSQKVANLKMSNGGNGMHSPSYSQMHSRMSESPKLRNGLNNSMASKSNEFYRSSLLKKNDENRNAESQESRLARMNFIERQEQVINKYRPKLHSDADGYGQSWANQSWGTTIQYGTPKH